jgi:hypothetical protein
MPASKCSNWHHLVGLVWRTGTLRAPPGLRSSHSGYLLHPWQKAGRSAPSEGAAGHAPSSIKPGAALAVGGADFLESLIAPMSIQQFRQVGGDITSWKSFHHLASAHYR